MPVRDVERRVDSLEISEWLAYDRLLAEEAARPMTPAKTVARSPFKALRRLTPEELEAKLDRFWPPEENVTAETRRA